MAYYFFDSTGLVKRYTREIGSRKVNALLSKRGRTAILATTAIADFYSVLAQKAREGELTRDDWYSTLVKFEGDCERGIWHFVAPTPQTVIATKHLIMEYPFLRAPQALQLALAQELRPLRLTVVSSDPNILQLCRSIGVAPVNPEED
ncbi:MAG: type II toxin-antitoxin system VapC family toxin [Nitrospirales bacterium]